MSIEYDLQTAHICLSRALKAIEEEPSTAEKVATLELIEVCKALDAGYEEWCIEHDESYGDEPGTTYNSELGTSMEFYVEADTFHRLSLAIRKLK